MQKQQLSQKEIVNLHPNRPFIMEDVTRETHKVANDTNGCAGCFKHICFAAILFITAIFFAICKSKLLGYACMIVIILVFLHGLWQLINSNY